jgi:hypothetical protein
MLSAGDRGLLFQLSHIYIKLRCFPGCTIAPFPVDFAGKKKSGAQLTDFSSHQPCEGFGVA